MAEFSNVATQTVAVNGNVLFTDGTQEFQIKEVPQRTSASGMRFY